MDQESGVVSGVVVDTGMGCRGVDLIPHQPTPPLLSCAHTVPMDVHLLSPAAVLLFHHTMSFSPPSFLFHLLLLVASCVLPSVLCQPGGCTYSGPFPFPSYGLTLVFSNTSIASLPPLFALLLSTALDYDLQQSSLAPTASTAADLPCTSATQATDDHSSALVGVAVLGSITVDCGLDPYQTTLQLILDLHAGLIQNATNYPIDPQQHVSAVVLCPDGSTVAVGQEGQCPGQGGGGGGLSEGLIIDIVILVLVVVSIAFGIVAWRALRLRENRLRREGLPYQ